MPIYAYKCSACGFAKDVLQKMSDPLLTDCPSCLQATFSKQVTAAGFQLKGSGWYVTDFRDGGSATAATAATAASPAATPVSTGDAPAAAATATPAPAASSASPE
jgi:putative FmdB family regulatory protein